MTAVTTQDPSLVKPEFENRLAALERECSELQRELTAARKKKWLVVGAFLLFVCITSFSFAGEWRRVQSQQTIDKLLSLAQERLGSNSDMYMKEVQTLIDHSAPILSEAFTTQAKKDLPAYMEAFGREREILVESLQKQFEERLKKHHHELLTHNEKLFRDEFPLVKNAELHDRMVNNLEIAAHSIAKKHCVGELEKQVNQLYDAWDRFPAAEPQSNSEEPMADQLLGSLFDLWMLRMTQPASHDN